MSRWLEPLRTLYRAISTAPRQPLCITISNTKSLKHGSPIKTVIKFDFRNYKLFYFLIKIIFLCNNLYGWVMGQYMTWAGSLWGTGNAEVTFSQLEWMQGTNNDGRVYELDVSYPQRLHNAYDLTLVPLTGVLPELTV